MTGKDSLPAPLMAPMYADERNALHAAVEPALEEDAKGTVSMATVKRINEAVAKFRAKFMKNAADFEPGYDDALNYFTTMASLSRLLNDPSMKDVPGEAREQRREDRRQPGRLHELSQSPLRAGHLGSTD